MGCPTKPPSLLDLLRESVENEKRLKRQLLIARQQTAMLDEQLKKVQERFWSEDASED
jgi:hypothetical protein